MVYYLLSFSAELENLTDLQPRGGCDDPAYPYYFRLKCENCGEVSQKETCVMISEEVPLPTGRGTANLVQKVWCVAAISLEILLNCRKEHKYTIHIARRNGEYFHEEHDRWTLLLILFSLSRCKLCGRDGSIQMIAGHGQPLTLEQSQKEEFAKLMIFDSRGFEPTDFSFADGWKAESMAGSTYNVDLSAGEFAEYDEKGACPVGISNLQAKFSVVKKQERRGGKDVYL